MCPIKRKNKEFGQKQDLFLTRIMFKSLCDWKSPVISITNRESADYCSQRHQVKDLEFDSVSEKLEIHEWSFSGWRLCGNVTL